MTAELYLARGVLQGRVHSEQDQAVLRNVELARQDERRSRRTRSAQR